MDYNEASTKDFTQKDLMQHLLNVAQHTATREDLSEMRKESDDKFDKLDSKIDDVAHKLDSKISSESNKILIIVGIMFATMTTILSVVMFLISK